MPAEVASGLFYQPAARRAEVRAGVVPELGDERMLLEGGLDDGPLHAAAAAVNEPELREARLMGGAHVFLDHRRDVARSERVQVQLGLDREFVHH